MTELDKIINNGFSLQDESTNTNYKDLALISLRIALKSYCSTYQASKDFFRELDKKNTTPDTEYSIEYFETYAETIVHLQHFIELILNMYLRNDHPLLACNISNNLEILYKLIHKKDITTAEESKIKTPHFNESFKLLLALIKEKIPTFESLNMFKTHQKEISELNNLRNRIWHRGTFILQYDALDQFMGKYIFPLLIQILELKELQELKHYWKLKIPECGIDVINEIMTELKKLNYDRKKIALLKEIGRASFEMPVTSNTELKSRTYKSKNHRNIILHLHSLDINKRKYEEKASKIADVGFASVVKCPVCGTNSLIKYTDFFDGTDDIGNQVNIEFTTDIQCECCSFHLGEEIGNPSKFGYSMIDNFWTE